MKPRHLRPRTAPAAAPVVWQPADFEWLADNFATAPRETVLARFPGRAMTQIRSAYGKALAARLRVKTERRQEFIAEWLRRGVI